MTVSSLLLTYLVHSTLLCGLAWLAARFVSDPARRELLWRAALFGGLLSAPLQVAAVPWTLAATRVPAPDWVAQEEPSPRPVALLAGVATRRSKALPTREPLSPVEPAPSARRGESRVLGGLWLLGAAAGLVALLLQHLALRRRLARRGAGSGGERELLRGLVDTHLARRIRITRSRALSSPIALSSREICLPARGLEDLGLAERRSMLAHEVAHVLRRDPLWLLVAQLVERVFFFQPLNVWLRRRMQAEAEFLCDDWAARRTGEPLALARCLAAVAQWNEARGTNLSLAPGMVARPSTLVRRVERLLEPRPRGTSRARFAGGLAVGLAIFACSAPGVGDGRRPDRTEEARIVANVRMEDSTDLRMDVRASGLARLLSADGEQQFASLDLSDEAGRRAMQAALAEQAARMPRGGPRMPGRELSPIDATLAAGRLSIHLGEGARATRLQNVLEMCASPEVQLWNVELVSSDGNRTYRVPLPVDVGLAPLEEAEIIEAEIVFEEPGPPTGVLELVARLGETPSGEPRVRLSLGKDDYEFPADRELDEAGRAERGAVLARLVELLKLQYADDPDLVVRIDPRPGIVYGDVVALMDAVIEAGFTNIVFVGSYER